MLNVCMQNVCKHNLYASHDINMVKQMKEKALDPPRDLQSFTTSDLGQFKGLFFSYVFVCSAKVWKNLPRSEA